MTRTFDHRLIGTPEARWQASALRELPRLDPPGAGGRLLVLAAHPDDESLGAAGLIAAATARGATVEVVVATDGEASHPHSPTHQPRRLAELRRAELTAAIGGLDPSAPVHFLGLPDGKLADHADELAAAMGTRPTPSHVITPWLGDGHPDHAACARAAEAVFASFAQHWQYPIWAWHWADPGDGADLPWSQLRRVDLAPAERAAKLRALSCHRSQHQPLSDAEGDEPMLSETTLDHFRRDFECFVVPPVEPAAATAGYFDELYAAAADPWQLGERFYERRKRELILAALPRPRFYRAFEPGCATGLLTELLAARCDKVVAWDGASAPVAAASERLAGRDHVHVERRRIPDDWPHGRFDLMVFSEVGYYCSDLDRLAERTRDALTPDGIVVACHWRRPAADHPHPAAAVHDALGAGLHRLVRHHEDDFLLDVWSADPASVAEREGLLG